jgi:hypothetical protein
MGVHAHGSYSVSTTLTAFVVGPATLGVPVPLSTFSGRQIHPASFESTAPRASSSPSPKSCSACIDIPPSAPSAVSSTKAAQQTSKCYTPSMKSHRSPPTSTSTPTHRSIPSSTTIPTPSPIAVPHNSCSHPAAPFPTQTADHAASLMKRL